MINPADLIDALTPPVNITKYTTATIRDGNIECTWHGATVTLPIDEVFTGEPLHNGSVTATIQRYLDRTMPVTPIEARRWGHYALTASGLVFIVDRPTRSVTLSDGPPSGTRMVPSWLREEKGVIVTEERGLVTVATQSWKNDARELLTQGVATLATLCEEIYDINNDDTRILVFEDDRTHFLVGHARLINRLSDTLTVRHKTYTVANIDDIATTAGTARN